MEIIGFWAYHAVTRYETGSLRQRLGGRWAIKGAAAIGMIETAEIFCDRRRNLVESAPGRRPELATVTGMIRGMRGEPTLFSVLAMFAALFSMPGAAMGQANPPPANNPFEIANPEDLAEGDYNQGIVPAHDRDAASWLKRSSDAAERQDWKLVADTLERVIRDHGSTLVLTSDDTYRSAIEIAQSQIASLPPDGLEAYRILYDPAAKRLLEQAQELHDLNPLREVARVYPHTSYGPEALDLLTSWLLDSMNPGEAIAFLNRLDGLAQSRVSASEINLRRAVALSLLRQPERALAALELATATGGGAEGIAERVAVIRAFVESDNADRLARTQYATAWESRMGPSSAGVAESLDPLVASNSASVVLLPSKEKADPKAFRDVSQRQGRPPVWQVVSDGELAFVSCPVGVMGLDAATFEVRWTGVPATLPVDPQINEQRLMMLGMGIPAPSRLEDAGHLDDYTTTSLYREYRGAVSTAHGLVFIIGQDAQQNERNPSQDGIPVGQMWGDSGMLAGGNALLAYDAKEGSLQWIRGRGGPEDHELADARFYSTPIAYGYNLLATYVRNGDLYLGELDVSGAVVKEVAIGTGRPSLFPLYALLEPTISNGVVYVPSGAGLLTALYEHDLSLRWLARYERLETLGQRNYARPGALINHELKVPNDEWLSTPPIQAGGLVLLAPPDADQLFAFDVETGKPMWTRPRGSDRYIVGASDDIVVIAGKSITALRVKDGTTLWTQDRDAAGRTEDLAAVVSETGTQRLAGRPLMLEDRLLVPTFNGMIGLDLETGERIGERVGEGMTLGNLRAFDGTLYSIGNTSIAKYPDPVRAQEIALNLLQRDPQNEQALLRLAWLATLRSEWTTALDWLDRADAAIASKRGARLTGADLERTGNSESSERVSHFRVSVLISMADEADDNMRSTLLEQAFAAARQPVDRASAGLALASHLFSLGQEREAGDLCVRLLARAEGRPMRIDDRWRIEDALEIGRRLRQFYRRSSPDARDAIETALQASIAEISSADDKASLVRIADALGFMPLGAALDLKIADLELSDGLIESAVHHLNRAMSRAEDPIVKQSAMVRLAIVCVAPPESVVQDPDTARRILQLLDDSDRAQSLATLAPAGYPGLPGTIGEFIDWCSARLPEATGARLPTILRDPIQLGLMTEAYVSRDPNDPPSHDVASFWDAERPYSTTAPVVPTLISNQYRGIRADASELNVYQWLHDPDVASTATPVDAAMREPRDMTVDGRVAVLVGPAQVEAIGLETGRTMWTPIPLTRHLGALPSPPVVSSEGIAVVATDPTTLVAAAMRDGAAPLWRRSFPDRHLGTIRIVDGRLICLDTLCHRASVLELETGLLLREYEVPIGGLAHVAESEAIDDVFGDMSAGPQAPHFAICGSYILRSQDTKVIARRATTGEVAWESEFEEGVKGIDQLNDTLAAIYHGSDGIRVVSSVSGSAVANLEGVGLELPPIDAVVDPSMGEAAPRLLLFTKLDDELEQEFALASFPLSGDAKPWRTELGTSATISRQMMRASPEYVAVVTNTTTEAPGLTPSGHKRLRIDTNVPAKLFVVGKRNGRRVGASPYSFYEGRLGSEPQDYEKHSEPGSRPPYNVSRVVQDVVILDGRMIAFAPEGYYVLADEDEVRASRDGKSTTGNHDAP